MTEYIIIEPHSDDAMLSAGDFMLNLQKKKGNNLKIVTCTNQDKDGKESWETKGMENHNCEVLNLEVKDFHFKHRHLGATDEEFVELYEFMIGADEMKKLSKGINTIISNVDEDTIIIAPLGLYHPFHRLVHRLVKDYAPIFYADIPYSDYKKCKADYEARIKSLGLALEWESDDSSDLKKQIFSEVYKSQIWFYNRAFWMQDRKMPEKIYRVK